MLRATGRSFNSPKIRMNPFPADQSNRLLHPAAAQPARPGATSPTTEAQDELDLQPHRFSELQARKEPSKMNNESSPRVGRQFRKLAAALHLPGSRGASPARSSPSRVTVQPVDAAEEALVDFSLQGAGRLLIVLPLPK